MNARQTDRTLDDLLARNRELAADNVELLDINEKLIALVHDAVEGIETLLTTIAAHGCSPTTAAKALLEVRKARQAAQRSAAKAKETH